MHASTGLHRCRYVRGRIEDCVLSADMLLVMRSRAIAVVIAVLLTACSSDTSDGSTTSVTPTEASTDAVETMTTQATGSTTSVPASTATSLDPDAVEVSDEVLDYLAAVEELLAETAYEDAVSEDPEVFIATGFLFCEQLTESEAPADILTVYVETLTGSDIEEAPDDDLALAGSILGSAVGYLCPEHTELIEEGL
jgi:hypothetical protein